MLAAWTALLVTTGIGLGVSIRYSHRLRFPLLIGLCLGIAWLPLCIVTIYIFEMLAS